MAKTPVQLLILAVIQEQDIDQAFQAIQRWGAPVVRLASSGGFLGRRNVTLLVGLPEGMEGRLLEALQQTCRQRVEYMTMSVEGAPLPLPAPIPVTVGGATIFALPVERFEEI